MACGSYQCSVNTNVKAECLQAKYLLSALRHRISTKAEDNRGKLKRTRGHENLYVVDLSPALQSVSMAQCSSRHLCAMWPVLCVRTHWWELSAASLCPEIEMQLLNNLAARIPGITAHSWPAFTARIPDLFQDNLLVLSWDWGRCWFRSTLWGFLLLK